jgi:hypothetical protein
MLARWVFAVALLLALGAGTAGASQDPYRDQAEKIACPAGPSGWFSPTADGRTILTPLATGTQPNDPTGYVPAPVVEVDCHYQTTAGKDFEVLVRYALPIDFNPWNDFYIGCTVTGHAQNVATAAHAWSDRDRIYRVVGAKTWSLATFIDDLKELTPADVPRFETIANTMLADAQPFAHDCMLPGGGGPVDLKSIWSFSFEAQTSSDGITSSGKTSGSFVTTANTSGGSIGTITNLFANNFRLRVTGKGTDGSIVLHVGDPIVFRHGYGALLRAHVAVLASNEKGCAKGSAGILLVSVQYLSAPRVAVTVCGRTYLDGKGQVSASMKPV